ncbi:MAG: stage III sporulation protein AB [Lachnospiraceae bacterium]
MLKLLGIFCILAGSTGFGIRMAKELDQRVEELRMLQQLMLSLRGEIRYLHRPLAEAFFHLSEYAAAPFGEFFRRTAQELECRRGSTAGEIWSRNQRICLAELHISPRERLELERLGRMLGYLDVEMQVNTLDHYLEQLKLSTGQAGETANNCRRLYQYMGILGGAAFVILVF